MTVSFTPDDLIPALTESIFDLNVPKARTILALHPKIALHPRLFEQDVLFTLRGPGMGEALRDLLYDTGWFPANAAFGKAVVMATQYEDVDTLRWYFARWWEREALPLSNELKLEFKQALQMAVEDAKLKCLALLLSRGVHRMTGAIQDMSLLHDAIRREHSDVLHLLLDAGFDPNATPDGVLLPIEVALASGRVADVQSLIRHGARLYVISSPPKVGTQANPFSEFREGQSWVRSIAQGYPWVHLLVEQQLIEKYDLLDRFIDSSAHALAISPERRTLAHELIKDKSWACSVERMPEERHTLNAKRLNLLRRVFDAGISPNQADDFGWTPVFQAVLIGDTDALSIMNSHRMNLNNCTGVGTALTLSCQRNDCHTTAWLLDHGADPHLHDDQGQYPMDYARESGDAVLQALIGSALTKIST
jgi:ankyrin repeat protein